MMEAFGWVVVRTSRAVYAEELRHEDEDQMDAEVDASDKELWAKMRAWLESQADPWLIWQFREQNNNAIGVLQFFTSRNHRSSCVWDLMAWISEHGAGSYGLVYVHDDEDIESVKSYGRGQADYSNEFRVWRILNGTVDELADPFLSPFVPNVNPSFYA